MNEVGFTYIDPCQADWTTGSKCIDYVRIRNPGAFLCLILHVPPVHEAIRMLVEIVNLPLLPYVAICISIIYVGLASILARRERRKEEAFFIPPPGL